MALRVGLICAPALIHISGHLQLLVYSLGATSLQWIMGVILPGLSIGWRVLQTHV